LVKKESELKRIFPQEERAIEQDMDAIQNQVLVGKLITGLVENGKKINNEKFKRNIRNVWY
jgi:hypothetical protein